MTKPLLTKQRRKTLSGSKSNIYNKVITIDVFWAEEPELNGSEFIGGVRRCAVGAKRQWANSGSEFNRGSTVLLLDAKPTSYPLIVLEQETLLEQETPGIL